MEAGRKPATSQKGRRRRPKAGSDLDSLLATLSEPGPDSLTQQRVREELAKLGGAAVEPLIGLLSHQEPDLRFRAATTLGDIGDARAVEPLIPLLNDGSDYVREAAREALKRLDGREAEDKLAQTITLWTADSNSAEQSASDSSLLKETGQNEDGNADKISPNAERGGLNVESTVMPKPAAGWLARLASKLRPPARSGTRGAAAQIQALIEELGNSEQEARDAARERLQKMGKRSVAPLIAALTHTNWNVRMEAAYALGEIRDRRAVEPLISAMEAALQSEDARFQMMAAIMLGRLGDRRAILPLAELAAKSPVQEVGQVANRALHQLRDKPF